MKPMRILAMSAPRVSLVVLVRKQGITRPPSKWISDVSSPRQTLSMSCVELRRAASSCVELRGTGC